MTSRRTFIIRRWCVGSVAAFAFGVVMHVTGTGCAELFCEVTK